jgi:hypothetical protein
VMMACVKGCILVLLKSHLRANRPNPNIIGLDGSCIRWMKTDDFIQSAVVPSSMRANTSKQAVECPEIYVLHGGHE